MFDRYVYQKLLSYLSEVDLIQCRMVVKDPDSPFNQALGTVIDRIVRPLMELLANPDLRTRLVEELCRDNKIVGLRYVTRQFPKYAYNWNYGLKGACRGGHQKLAEWTIEKGANDWNMGLKGACWGGHQKLAEWSIEKGANDWDMGLVAACRGGHRKLAEWMIEKGAKFQNLAGIGQIWLDGFYAACKGDHIDLVEWMFEKVNLMPIEQHLIIGFGDFTELNLFLFDQGLFIACEKGHRNLVELMIKKVEGKTRCLNSGLSGACYGGNPDLVERMIEEGADDFDEGLEGACRGRHLVSVNYSEETKEAALYPYKKLIELMVEKGATSCDACNELAEDHLENFFQKKV